jgi:Pilus formation protein N terminal region
MRMSRRPSPFVLGSLAAIAGVVMASGVVWADPINLSTDQVRLVTFSRPVKTVFVANPVIADITVIDGTRAFVQGKNLGTTQLVALDENGRETFNDRITVRSPPGSVVTLQRGKTQTTMNCMDARCTTAPIIGDAPEPFETTLGQITKGEAMKRALSQ